MSVFLERIGTWSLENEKIFAQVTGYDKNTDYLAGAIRDTKTLIKQKYSYLLDGFQGYNISYIDLSVDEIIQKMHEKYGDSVSDIPEVEVSHISTSILYFLHTNISDIWKKYFSSFVTLSFLLTPDTDILSGSEDSLLNDLELNFRDENLTRALLVSKEKSIIVLYGEWHIPWVYKRLREVDPRWSIIDKKEYRVFSR